MENSKIPQIADIKESASYQAIQNSPFFKSMGLTEEETLMLAVIGRNREFEENQHVFSMKEEGPSFYLVASGAFELYLANGKIKNIFVGDLFGQVSAFSEILRLGTVICRGEGALIAFNANLFLPGTELPAPLAQKVLLGLLKLTTSYIPEFISYISESTEDLIRKGEGETVEFKEAVTKNNIHRVMDTISAFINSKGGTLMVGVADDGTIMGADFIGLSEKKGFSSQDQFFNVLNNQFRSRIGAEYAFNIHPEWQEINGKNVLRIDCLPSDHPSFVMRAGREEFYFRKGSVTMQIKSNNEIFEYLYRRRLNKERLKLEV